MDQWAQTLNYWLLILRKIACGEMKIILDLDGVMIPVKSWKPAELEADNFYAFSAKAISVLSQLITSDTEIVLSTSHKARFRVNEWKTIFKNRGLAVSRIAKINRNRLPGKSRKDEILEYLNKTNLQHGFIILDDDKSLNDLPPDLKKFLVQTEAMIGLNEEHLSLIQAVVKQHRAPTNARSLPATVEVATKPARVRRDVHGGSRKSNKW